MDGSEEKRRQLKGAGERFEPREDSFADAGEQIRPRRVPAPSQEPEPTDHSTTFPESDNNRHASRNNQEAVTPVQYPEDTVYAGPAISREPASQGQADLNLRRRPVSQNRPMQAGTPISNDGTIHADRFDPTTGTTQRTRPIRTKRSSQDWEDTFIKDKKLSVNARRIIDKVIFILVLLAFLAVLFLLMFDVGGEDPARALQEFFSKGNPIQILKDAADRSRDPGVYMSDTQQSQTQMNLSLQPALPAAPVFPLPIESRSYVVWDVTDETLLYEAAAEEIRDPASLSKVMTALLVFRSGTSLDTTITLADADFTGLHEMDASMAGFKPGETLTIRDLLYGMLLPSGAEASIALARHMAGSEAEFVVLMNEAAQDLGMSKTVFYNSTGLTIDGHNNTTTARDLLALFRATIEYPEFVEIAGTHMRSLPANTFHPEGLDLISTFTWRFNSDPDYRSNILAGKSGYNGRELTLGTLATVGGKNYLVITLAASTENGQPGDAIHDHVVIHNHILSLEQ